LGSILYDEQSIDNFFDRRGDRHGRRDRRSVRPTNGAKPGSDDDADADAIAVGFRNAGANTGCDSVAGSVAVTGDRADAHDPTVTLFRSLAVSRGRRISAPASIIILLAGTERFRAGCPHVATNPRRPGGR
jgi:hypothetical protein